MITFSKKQKHIEELKKQLLENNDDTFELINKAFDHGYMTGRQHAMEEVKKLIDPEDDL